MPYYKLIDQNILEIGHLDKINKGGHAIQKYIYTDDPVGEETGACLVEDLPKIGDTYEDISDTPDMTGQMMVYQITSSVQSDREEFLVHAKTYGDILDRDSFDFTMGGEIMAFQPDSEDPEIEEDWIWNSDSAPVKQAIYVSNLSGSITIPVFVPVTDRATYTATLRSCLGRVNSLSKLTHPALTEFGEATLLFNTISGGERVPGIGTAGVGPAVEYLQYNLTFSFRFIDGFEYDTWNYIYRTDEGRFDRPYLSGTSNSLYKQANFANLFPAYTPVTVLPKEYPTCRFVIDDYQVSDENGSDSMDKNALVTTTYITEKVGDAVSCASNTVLPVIGDTYVPDGALHYDPGATCRVYRIVRTALTNDRFEYNIHYQAINTEIDEDDFNLTGGGEVLTLTPNTDDNGVLYGEWDWVWEGGGEVMNALFKATSLGTIDITRVVSAEPAGEGEITSAYEDWFTSIKAAAGHINEDDYTTTVPPHPALSGFKEGQLLLSSISGGRLTCDEFGNKVYLFELSFMYKIIGENITEDDWQYIYRQDTGTWDKPVNVKNSNLLYNVSDFGGI